MKVRYRYYTKRQIIKIIEREGTEYFYCCMEYIAFGVWEIH